MAGPPRKSAKSASAWKSPPTPPPRSNLFSTRVNSFHRRGLGSSGRAFPSYQFRRRAAGFRNGIASAPTAALPRSAPSRKHRSQASHKQRPTILRLQLHKSSSTKLRTLTHRLNPLSSSTSNINNISCTYGSNVHNLQL